MKLSDAFDPSDRDRRSPFIDFSKIFIDFAKLAPAIDYSKSAPAIDFAKLAPAFDYSKLAPAIDFAKLAPAFDFAKLAPAIDYSKLAPAIDFAKLAPAIDLGNFGIDFRFPDFKMALADELLGRVQELVSDDFDPEIDSTSIVEIWKESLFELREWLARPNHLAVAVGVAVAAITVCWFNLIVYYPALSELVAEPLWAAISLIVGWMIAKRGR
jgi:hypothetical protein